MNDEKTRTTFQDLEIWQLAHQLVIRVYQLIKSFPSSEKFILTSQLLRAALSIPANIAEGYGRRSKKEFIQFLYISLGSLEEVRYYLILAKDLGYVHAQDLKDFFDLTEKIRAKILSFIRYLNK